MESATGVTVASVDVVVQQLDEEFDDEDAADDGDPSAAVSASQAVAMAGLPTIG